MSNPTAVWSWTQPSPNDDPWDVKFDTLISAIDTTVGSVNTRVASAEAVAGGYNTLVMSVVPTGAAYSITGSTGTGDWFVASVTAFGRYVGSFSVTMSGSLPVFTVTAKGQLASGGTGAFGRTANLFHRLVINPGSITVPGSSGAAWSYVVPFADARVAIGFQAVTSLGPGTYSVEAQWRLSTISAASFWQQQQTDQYILTVVEGRRGL